MDKEPAPDNNLSVFEIGYITPQTVSELKQKYKLDLLFLSFPVNYRHVPFADCCDLFDQILYHGINNQNTACGNADLYAALLCREVVLEGPRIRSGQLYETNQLIFYGPKLPENKTREPLTEEKTGWKNGSYRS